MNLLGKKKKKNAEAPADKPVAQETKPEASEVKAGVATKKEKQSESKKKSPFLAAILGFLIPGLGFIYTGLILHGIVVLVTSVLVIPYIYGIVGSFSTAKKINNGQAYGAKLGLFLSIISGLVFMLIMSFLVLPVIMPLVAKAVVAGKENSVKPVVVAKLTAPAEPVDESMEQVSIPEPEDFFEGGEGIPVYPGSDLMGTIMRENYLGHKFAVKAPLKTVVSFYKKTLVAAGYKLMSSDYTDSAKKTTLSFVKGTTECKIDLDKNEAGSTSGLLSITQ